MAKTRLFMNRIIAIDGPVASGKGTLAKKLAKFYGLPYLNTGGLYRAIGLHLLRNSIGDSLDKDKILVLMDGADFSNLDNPDLYAEEVSAITSKIAVIPEVRKFLFNLQVDFANQDGGAVLDGRDIGTVICPGASYKFFIMASVEERARRRYRELLLRDKSIDYNEILSSLRERDRRDSERADSPLKRAEDAREVDTTSMGIDEVFSYVRSFIRF
ncbi:MAG: (d)CMP kinase [Rickettsiales bacterium]|jgi:cytidylate kinase|nr:(d)CMP kinase [Rickettsiales bacterium]